MRVTILRPGLTNANGISMPVGSVQVVSDDFGRSLVQSLGASDTDSFLSIPPNDPYARAKLTTPPSLIPEPPGLWLVTDGNSITAVAGAPSTVSLAPQANAGWLNWGLAFSGQTMRWIEQQAVSGRTIAQCIGLLPNWLNATQANVLCFQEGTNSIAAYSTLTGSDARAAILAWADMLTYLAAVKASNKFIRVILPTVIPRASTATRNEAHQWFNRQLRQLCANDTFYVLVDFWKVVVDPASVTFSAKANFLRADDNLHPTPKGARPMGKEWARVIGLAFGTPQSSLVPVDKMNRALAPTALMINSNPTLTGGTAGTAIGTATGTFATGWRGGNTTGTATSVGSIVADDEGFGNLQRLTVTAASDGGVIAIVNNNTEALPYQSANDYLKAVAKVRWSGCINVRSIVIRISGVWDASYSVDGFSDSAATATIADFDQSDMTDFFIMTGPAIRFPGNVAANTILSIGVFVTFLGAGGAITLDVSRAGLINLGQSITEF